MTDLYAVLGVPSTATATEIKRAYRRAALHLHPDRNPQDPAGATERFKTLGAAFATLGDPGRRAIYDRARTTPPRAAQRAPARPWAGFSAHRWGVPVDLGEDDDFERHFGTYRPPRRSRRTTRASGYGYPGCERTGAGVYPDASGYGYPGCERAGAGVYPDEGRCAGDPADGPPLEDEVAAAGGEVDLGDDPPRRYR